MTIFAEYAPLYRAAGIPVMPVKGKAAFLKDWSRYCTEPVSSEEFEVWVRQYGHYNIGIPLGTLSGLVIVDVDTDVPAYKEVIEKILPPPVWIRVGSKGYASAYRYEGHEGSQLYATNDLQLDSPILELLGQGRQVVVPPSIHPKTQLPYAANIELYKVMDQLGSLPRDFMRRVQKAFKEAGIEVSPTKAGGAASRVRGKLRLSDHVPMGGRDIAMTKIAGQLAVDVRAGESTFMEALAIIDQWNKNSVERRQGDEIDPNKGMENLAKFILKDLAAGSTLPGGWDKDMPPEIRHGYGLDQVGGGQIRHAVADIAKKFEEDFTNGGAIQQLIDQTLHALVTSTTPDSLEEVRLLKIAATHSKKSPNEYTIAELKRELKRLRSMTDEGGEDTQHHSRVADAMLAVMDAVEISPFGDGSIWEWDGEKYVRWNMSYLIPEIGHRFGGEEFVKKASDFKQIAQLTLGTAQKQFEMGERPGMVRQPVINFRNGVLDEKLMLHSHRREFSCHYMLDIEYSPTKADECPMWLKLLDDFWGKDPDGADKILALRQAMAATLFGVATRYERAFCFYGDGKNGKSTVLKILEGIFPANLRASLSLEDFGSRFGPVSLDGKLLNIGQEIRENVGIDDKMLKEIVSGSEMEVEQKGEPRYKMKPIAAHWFGTNNIPRVNETSMGMQRRLLMFDFHREFSAEETIRDLATIILNKEREAIVCWAVEAIVGLEEYALPASHYRLMHDFVVRNNSVLAWLMNQVENRRMVFEDGAPFLAQDAAYSIYKNWCHSASTNPTRLDRFQREMSKATKHYEFIAVNADLGAGEVAGYRRIKFPLKK